MTDQLTQQQVNQTAWAACDTFRGAVDSGQYKDYILVMLFLKYISDHWNDHLENYRKLYGGDETRIRRRLERERFVLPEGASFYDLYEARNEPNIGERINIALERIEDANRAKLPGYELQVKGALLRFLALLLAQGRQRLAAETADTQRLKTLLQWLSAHYTEELRVADAAGVCSFSASHFMRWFRQMTGQSFVAFLNEYRLNAAAEALQATDETVLTIASRCGFENLSYFNRVFKAHFGMTPREYRKK